MPLPFIGAAVIFGARALIRSPGARRVVAKGIGRARGAVSRFPGIRPVARRPGRAIAGIRPPGARALAVGGRGLVRRAAPAVGAALALGGAFELGSRVAGQVLGGLSRGPRPGGPGPPPPAPPATEVLRPRPVPVAGGAPPGQPVSPGPRLRPQPIPRRMPMPNGNGPRQIQQLRTDVPLEMAEIVIVKTWQTFPGGPVFTMFSNGKIAVRRKNGTLKVYRPARNIVISRNPRVGTLLRADSRMDSLIGRLKKVINRRSSGGTTRRKRGAAKATASASSR